ncbi:MAG: hypothetical protein ACJAZN_003842, partial [Planctomycetota bacterium]
MNKSSILIAAAVLAGPAFAQGTDECVGATPLTLGAPMAFDTTAATLSAEIWPCAASTSP